MTASGRSAIRSSAQGETKLGQQYELLQSCDNANIDDKEKQRIISRIVLSQLVMVVLALGHS
jgi:hypothetical protein